jgi:hypothetical protein
MLRGQGILALQNNLNKPTAEKPMTYSATLGGGYDRLEYSVPGLGDIDSPFTQAGVGMMYSDIDRATSWNLGLDLGALYYFDMPEGLDEYNYQAKIAFNIAHQASERLRFNNNFFVTYEIEPNFGVGASTARRNGQYLYGFNNFSVAYAWSERFSTTSSYTIDGIRYDDSRIGQFEDRLTHLFAQQFSYAISKTLKGVAEYRFRTVRYDQAKTANFMSHYALLGVDKAWSERTSGSVRVGAEFYDSKRTQETAPYAEGALNYSLSEKTTLQAFASLGFDGSELGNFGSRYSARTGVTATHDISERFRVNGTVNYIYSEFNSADSGSASDFAEHQINASAGLGYRVYDNISLDANYTFTMLESGNVFREFDRNRIYLGVNASF